MYAEIIATFRYGRDDLDVLGITFKKDLYTVSTGTMGWGLKVFSGDTESGDCFRAI